MLATVIELINVVSFSLVAVELCGYLALVHRQPRFLSGLSYDGLRAGLLLGFPGDVGSPAYCRGSRHGQGLVERVPEDPAPRPSHPGRHGVFLPMQTFGGPDRRNRGVSELVLDGTLMADIDTILE